jgi:hypothetical protein
MPAWYSMRSVQESFVVSPNAVRVFDGDTIVLWDGSNAGEVFRARQGVLSSTMTLLKHCSAFNRNYFFYAVKNLESLLKAQTSGSGIPHVDKEILGNLTLFDFPKLEQSKIADVLSTIDRAIEQTAALISKQQRIKWGLRVKQHARRLGTNVTVAKIVDNRYRWGSCTITNALNFNWRLIKAPMFVIDYVVIHELAHLLEANHTARFWSIVRTHAPLMDKAKAWLKEHGQVLEEDL